MQQRKKFYLRQALEQYTEGINMQSADSILNSVLYSNRAHVNFLLGNYRNALLDGQSAARANPDNVKAYYRAAKGALGIKRYLECQDFCLKGLQVEPDNTELQDLAQAAKEEALLEEARIAAEAKIHAEKRSPAAALADALLSRGWKLGRPQFSVGTHKPWADSVGLIHWPVLLFYPEAGMGSDTVQDWVENDRFKDHLDVMFGADAPALTWDTDANAYSREKIELYYLSHGAEALQKQELIEALYGGWPERREEGPARYGDKAARWVKVHEGWTLGDVLKRPDHVVPGVPAFFVLSLETPFRTQFLEGELPLL